MRTAMIIFLLMCFIATGCMKYTNSKDEILITAEQIKDSFERYHILLSEPKGLSPENVFLRTLNGVKPETYTINENQLISFYIYSSSEEADKGVKDFEDSTAAAGVVMHSRYQIANALLLYVTEGSTKDERIKEIVEGLLVTK